ncbi:MAG: hypothetical protein IE926_15110, partial [Micrococcales bacterium]|nr:hypothetical protein [Micrococcales bacterium]
MTTPRSTVPGRRLLVAAGFTAALLVVPTTPASAGTHHGPTPPKPVVRSDQLAAPFNLDVSGRSVLVADGGQNLVGTLARDGSITPIATDQPGASG